MEWEGDGMVCLCSKTYYAFEEGDEEAEQRHREGLPPIYKDKWKNKPSTKGVSKNPHINYFSKQSFLDILLKDPTQPPQETEQGEEGEADIETGDCENRSFRMLQVRIIR